MHHHQILLTPQLKPLTLNSKPDIMYCKKCGKVIPDDSLFCQYCGEQLSDSKPPKKQMWKSPLSRFQSLSRGWQICIMSYVCWVFLWIILWIDEDVQGIDIVIFVFMLPILALFIWYYFTALRIKRHSKRPPIPKKLLHLTCKAVQSIRFFLYSLLRSHSEKCRLKSSVIIMDLQHPIAHLQMQKVS